MTTPWVATRQDLYAFGNLPPAACVPDARQLAGVLGASNRLDLPGHALEGGALVSFAARTGATLDTAIDSTTEYSVTVINGRFFRIAGITLANNGVGLPWMFENVEPTIDRIMLAFTSRLIASAKAYAGPWYAPPDWAPMIVAQLAAPTIAGRLRIAAARYDVEAVKAAYVSAEAFEADLRQGVPMNDGVGPIDADTIPNDGPRARGRLPVGWGARGYL